mgnify:CR=1 FL=1
MKFYYSPASPFVRKCMLVAHERDLTSKLELVTVSTTVVAPDPKLAEVNPLKRIPALVTDDGALLVDSRVICAYLDTLHDGKRLIPRSGPKRFEVMTLEAIADGIADSAVNNRYETALRPAEKQWKEWSDGQMGKITSALDYLESQGTRSLGREPHLGSLALGSALGYLDFRYPDWNWRRGRPKLKRWFEKLCERPSFVATDPNKN